MNAVAASSPLPQVDDLARRVLEPLCEHDTLIRYLSGIKFERVRFMQPLAADRRPDALSRALRRMDEMPSAAELERWYQDLKRALETPPDDDLTRLVVALMMDTLKGKIDNPAVIIAAFSISIEDARMSPQIVAGAVKRAWLKFKTKPSIQSFMPVCVAHRAETQAALDQVCRAIGLRRDAAKVAERQGLMEARGADTRRLG